MASRHYDDWEDESYEDWQSDDEESVDEQELSEEDEETTVACPYCGRAIFDDSEWCPYCENYISSLDQPAPRRSWWFIVGFLLCAAVIYLWIVGG